MRKSRKKSHDSNAILILVGICFAILGAYLMIDILLKFLTFFVGLILFVIGLNLIMGKRIGLLGL